MFAALLSSPYFSAFNFSRQKGCVQPREVAQKSLQSAACCLSAVYFPNQNKVSVCVGFSFRAVWFLSEKFIIGQYSVKSNDFFLFSYSQPVRICKLVCWKNWRLESVFQVICRLELEWKNKTKTSVCPERWRGFWVNECHQK